MRFKGLDYFDRWDIGNDNLLDEREFATGIFTLWKEAETDGIFDETEYKAVFVKYYDVDVVKYLPERG